MAKYKISLTNDFNEFETIVSADTGNPAAQINWAAETFVNQSGLEKATTVFVSDGTDVYEVFVAVVITFFGEIQGVNGLPLFS